MLEMSDGDQGDGELKLLLSANTFSTVYLPASAAYDLQRTGNNVNDLPFSSFSCYLFNSLLPHRDSFLGLVTSTLSQHTNTGALIKSWRTKRKQNTRIQQCQIQRNMPDRPLQRVKSSRTQIRV